MPALSGAVGFALRYAGGGLLAARLPLTGYHAWHAAEADLLRRLGWNADTRQACDAAIAATQNSAGRAYPSRKRGESVQAEPLLETDPSATPEHADFKELQVAG